MQLLSKVWPQQSYSRIPLLLLDDEFSGILNVTDHEVTPHKDYVTIGLVGEYRVFRL